MHFFFSVLPPPPSSTLFPYTTLFRSRWIDGHQIKSASRSGASLWNAPGLGPPSEISPTPLCRGEIRTGIGFRGPSHGSPNLHEAAAETDLSGDRGSHHG